MKNIAFFFLACGVLFVNVLVAQPTKLWDRTYGGSEENVLYVMIVTPDGGFLLGGYSTSVASIDKTESCRGFSDYWVVKINANGNKLWDKTFGGDNVDHLTSMVATSDGGFLLGGWSDSNAGFDKSDSPRGSYYDYWVVKIDAAGNKLWDKTYGGNDWDELTSMTATPDGGFLLGGYSSSNTGFDKSDSQRGGYDYWLVKIDSSGKKLWDKTFGGDFVNQLFSMVATPDGGFLLGGYSNSNAGFDKTDNTRGDYSYDYWVVRIDANGNKLWDKTYGGADDERLISMIVVKDSGFLLGGYSESDAGFDKSDGKRGETDYWVVRIDANGNKEWDRTFGGAEKDEFSSMLTSSDGGFLLGGSSNSNAGFDKSESNRGDYDYSDYWMVKIDSNGKKLWDKTYGGAGMDELSSMVAMPGGDLLLGGSDASSNGFDRDAPNKGYLDYWVLRLHIPLTGISPTIQTLETNIYPNPSDGRFTVQFDAQTAEPVTLTLTDLTGRTVYETHVAPQVGFNETSVETDVANGVYVLRLQQGATWKQAKIVIN